MEQRKEIFSIRKTVLGVGSVMLASILFAQHASADETSSIVEQPVFNTEQISNLPSKVDASITKAETEYATYDTLDYDTNEVITKGNDLTPKVDTSIIKAKTEYVADDTLDYGTNEVVTKAKDGKIEKVTSYKTVESNESLIDQSARDSMISTDYKYGSSDFYHVDDTKEKPSDKVVVDKLFSDIKPISEEELKTNSSVRELVTAVEHYPVHSRTEEDRHKALLKLVSQDGSKPDIYLTTESLNPENPGFLTLLKDYQFTRSTPFASETVNSSSSNLKEILYYELLQKSVENLTNLAGLRYIDGLIENDGKEDTAVKGYFTSQLPITEELYADAKANYERYRQAYTVLDIDSRIAAGETVALHQRMGGSSGYIKDAWSGLLSGDSAFEMITKRYNLGKGYSEKFEISNESNMISNEELESFRNQIEKLPEVLKNNLLKLTIKESIGEAEGGLGFFKFASQEIIQKYEKEREDYVLTTSGKKGIKLQLKQPLALMDNLLHELGHAVDHRTGYTIYDNNKYQQDIKMESSGARLSQSEEFLKVFEEYFLNKEDIWEYIKYTPVEAWADSFGEYVNHKFFDIPYTRYKKIGDIVYSYKPSYSGVNPEYDAMKNTVYDVGYSPVEASEAYWESIYKKLFEPKRTTKIVVDAIVTNVTPAQNGKVLVGTKPKTVIKTIAYNTKYINDPTHPVGYRLVKQAGENAQVQYSTLYSLVDVSTGEIKSNEVRTMIKEAVDEIVVIGTKMVQTVSSNTIKPAEKPTEVKPTEVKPTEVKPTEIKPTEVKPTEVKPIDVKTPAKKSTNVKTINLSQVSSLSPEPVNNSGKMVTLTSESDIFLKLNGTHINKYNLLPNTGANATMLSTLLGIMALGLGISITRKRRYKK